MLLRSLSIHSGLLLHHVYVNRLQRQFGFDMAGMNYVLPGKNQSLYSQSTINAETFCLNDTGVKIPGVRDV